MYKKLDRLILSAIKRGGNVYECEKVKEESILMGFEYMRSPQRIMDARLRYLRKCGKIKYGWHFPKN